MASHPSPTPALIDALHSAVGSPDQVMQRAPDRLAFAHDASHYLLTPQAVVAPNGPDEVARLLRASAEQGVPLTFRAGGTSLSGQAVTDAVLVDTRRNFRDIEVLDDGARVRVQPGVTVRQVNSRLARFGRKLGPDPASEVACTIGGVIANNSSGMSCGTRYNTYQTLESLVIVLPSGTVIDTAAVDPVFKLQVSDVLNYQWKQAAGAWAQNADAIDQLGAAPAGQFLAVDEMIRRRLSGEIAPMVA